MDKQELAKLLMSTFLDEMHEHVETFNRDLLALEKQPGDQERDELVHSLFRAAHSLKGASKAVNIGILEKVCHKMEDILAEVREGQRQITAPLFALLFKVADGLEEAGMQLRDEQSLAECSLHGLLEPLSQAAAARSTQDGYAGSPEERQATAVESASPPEADDAKAAASHSGLDRAPTTSKQSTTDSEPTDEPTDEPAIEPAIELADTDAELEQTDLPSDEDTAFEIAAKDTSSPIRSPQRTSSIRVAAEKLDSLLAQSGELLIARRRVDSRILDAASVHESIAEMRACWRELEQPLAKLIESRQHPGQQPQSLPRKVVVTLRKTAHWLKQIEKESEHLVSAMTKDGRILAQTCELLDGEVHRVRMLPLIEACGGLHRAVRDIANDCNKQARLTIQDNDVEVDRSVVEALRDPLMHLVRNAMDHGIETVEERLANGKPAEAEVKISASLHGGHVEVIVSDDGRGFDVERIREKLRKKGLPEPQDEQELVRSVFLPGFSTAAIVTDVSGRGVGLDVVENRIQSLHGKVDVEFEPGRGTRFILTVPLTLTTIRCVLSKAGGQTFAVPTANVLKLERFTGDRVRELGGRHVLLTENESPLPIASLSRVLGFGSRSPSDDNEKRLAMVLSAGDQRAALLVDELVAEQEILVKSLGSRIRRVQYISGATLLPSGRVALVLNVVNVLRSALGHAMQEFARPLEKRREMRQRRLLAVDDSVTTRSLLRSILDAAGYQVTVAVDGSQAWQLLNDGDFDLIVSDVDMPLMDGFDLTRAVRESDRFADIPVVLVTARNTDEDRRRGVQVGASAYLEKGRFEQGNLLETIEQLL